MRLCGEQGCERKHFARGKCTKHYQRGRKYIRPKRLSSLPVPDGSKICQRCRIEKKLTDFARHGTNADGFRQRCRTCYSDDSREWRKNNPVAARSSWLKRKYGITIQDYERILTEQDGRCAICFIPEVEALMQCLAVDHDHSTGTVRGLLCTGCNTGLGNYEDSPDRLKRAAEYLLKGRK